MEVPAPRIDELLRAAIAQKRLIQFHYKDKPRIVEPHDYGIHNGSIKLFGFQVAGLSSHPLPNLALGAGELDFGSRSAEPRVPWPSAGAFRKTSSMGPDLRPRGAA